MDDEDDEVDEDDGMLYDATDDVDADWTEPGEVDEREEEFETKVVEEEETVVKEFVGTWRPFHSEYPNIRHVSTSSRDALTPECVSMTTGGEAAPEPEVAPSTSFPNFRRDWRG